MQLQVEEHFKAALALHREINEPSGMASALNGIALIAVARGQDDQAGQAFDELLRISREVDDPDMIGIAQNNRADRFRRRSGRGKCDARFSPSSDGGSPWPADRESTATRRDRRSRQTPV